MHLTARRAVLSTAAAALAAAALVAAPSPAAAESASVAGCPPVPTVKPFAPWQDLADYVLAPGGDIEAGAATWQLEGGAHPVEGNESFGVGAPTDHRSLALPTGSVATTAPMCIGIEHKTMRFFIAGAASAKVVVHALYTKRNGIEKAVRLGAVQAGGAWTPSAALAMRVNERAEDFDNAMSVSLRFAPQGDGALQIDDVYVDPYRSK